MVIHRIRNLPEFVRHWRRTRPVMIERNAFADSLSDPHRAERRAFSVAGFSYPANQLVDLRVDWTSSNGDRPNWRESLLCPVTGLNSRLRATVHLIETELELYPDSAVYLSEQVTPLFSLLRTRYPQLAGSEYLGPRETPGAVNAQGIRHEDATQLSFPAEQFDAVLSFECLEHIPDFRAALREAFRVLRPGGRFFLTAPFCGGQDAHTIRATLRADGTVEHHLPPEYHGDPIGGSPCLCFTQFGWKLMEDLRACGFVDPHVLALWSQPFGYLGEEQLFFLARKP